jgi:hypothetical protein
MKIKGKWIVVSANIIDRKLHIKDFFSNVMAINHAIELHRFDDISITTVQVDKNHYITSFDSTMNVVQITRVIRLDIDNTTQTYPLQTFWAD